MLTALLAVFSGALIRSMLHQPVPEGRSCLGVKILTEEEMSQLQQGVPRDYSENIMYQGEFAPVDQKTSVIYISQNITPETRAEALLGSLSVDSPGKTLRFAPDKYWDDLSSAAAAGHTFKLLVTDRKNEYTQYDVVFTTLPVITMYGEILYKDGEMRNVYSGQFRLWDPSGTDSAGPNLISSRVHWHVRGKTAGGQDKKPWKLSLKNMDSKNNSENLLNLGSDDDWILNAMNMEDSNVREKLFMDLWNEMTAQTDYNYPMSRGEYVEVLVDGEYSGLYLLQRRVDDRYLELDRNDVLVKGQWDGVQLSCEFVSAAKGDEVQNQLISAYFYRDMFQTLDVHNFTDVNLFMQFFCAADNQSYKNMYYLFGGQEDGYPVKLIPWDTDMTFGIEWVPETDGFAYNYNGNLTKTVQRREMDSMMQLHPDLRETMNARWKELRQDILSEDHIFQKIQEYVSCLNKSGAVSRDEEVWGLYHGGEDSLKNLYSFIEERLEFLDGYYK